MSHKAVRKENTAQSDPCGSRNKAGWINYADHTADNIKVFSDADDNNYTFEVCIYHKNKAICDALFSGGNIQKEPLDFMLSNKAESSLRLVENHSEELDSPEYIQQAIQWINE